MMSYECEVFEIRLAMIQRQMMEELGGVENLSVNQVFVGLVCG